MAAVRARLADGDPAGPADLLTMAGRLLVSTVGGASGPLYGTFFLDAGQVLRDTGWGVAELGEALVAGVAGVGRRGRSAAGQKTMLDTLVPAVATLRAALLAGHDLAGAASRAAEAAAAGCASTRDMVAQRGRASYLGERAIGHLDPGAVSSRLLVQALAAAAGAQEPASTPADVRR